MSGAPLAQPIFLVGMGRSGSTVVFECLATHRDLGWFAHHANRFPTHPSLYALLRLCDLSLAFRKSIERSDEARRWIEKLRLGPAEAYETWQSLVGARFRNDWLVGARATDAERAAVHDLVRAVLRWSGKRRFAAKLTGPPRIGFVASLFPDARFVHVLRDGRAVVRSLLQVDFWRDTHRLNTPAWSGLPEAYVELWRRHGGTPAALAAVQWRYAVEAARSEAASLAPGQYSELRYEAFVADPEGTIDRLLADCALAPCPRIQRFLRTRFDVRDRNVAGPAEGPAEERRALDEILGPTLAALGYVA
jgi:hypothetical protein